MSRLTEAQWTLLSELADRAHNVAENYLPARKLVALGYAEWAQRSFSSTMLTITPAGRAALEGRQ